MTTTIKAMDAVKFPGCFSGCSGLDWYESCPATTDDAVAELTALMREVYAEMYASGTRTASPEHGLSIQPYDTWPLFACHELMVCIYNRPLASNNAAGWDWPLLRSSGREWLLRSLQILGQVHQRCRNSDVAWEWSDRAAKAVCRLQRDEILATFADRFAD